MDYEISSNGTLRSERRLGEGKFIFEARGIRQEPSGVHARITLGFNSTILTWSYFNVERDEDRTRLANAAHRLLGPVAQRAYPKEHLKHELDLFSLGLWEASLSPIQAVSLVGAEEDTLPQFILEPYILEGGGTVLFAPPGRGKSYLALLMAISIDAGISPLYPVQQQPVLFINLERSQKSLRDRIGHINQALGLPRARPLITISAKGRSLANIYPVAQKVIGEKAISVIFLDSISRAGFGDLKDDKPMNTLVDNLNALCPNWFALAHTPRADESHAYGNIMLDAGADIVIQLLSEQKEDSPDLGLGLQIVKANDLPRQSLQTLTLEFNAYGLWKVRRAQKGEFPQIEAARKPDILTMIKEYLLDAGKATATEIAEALGKDRANVAHILATNGTFLRLPRTTPTKGRPSVEYGVRQQPFTPEAFR